MAHATVIPQRLRFHDDDLIVDVLRTVGYRGRCSCGWKGRLRDSRYDARRDARLHRRTHAP